MAGDAAPEAFVSEACPTLVPLRYRVIVPPSTAAAMSVVVPCCSRGTGIVAGNAWLSPSCDAGDQQQRDDAGSNEDPAPLKAAPGARSFGRGRGNRGGLLLHRRRQRHRGLARDRLDELAAAREAVRGILGQRAHQRVLDVLG